MARKGIIGNWQQTKYVSRETSEQGLLLRPSTGWYCAFDDQPQIIHESMPEENVSFRVVALDAPMVTYGRIVSFTYDDGRLVTNLNNNFNMRVAIYGYGLFNINNQIETSEAWDNGTIQNVAYQSFESIISPLTPLLFIPPGYQNGTSSLSNFSVNATRNYIDTIGGGTGNQLNYYPDYEGDLLYMDGLGTIVPMPEWQDKSYNFFESSGTANNNTNSRGVWVWRTYYYWSR